MKIRIVSHKLSYFIDGYLLFHFSNAVYIYILIRYINLLILTISLFLIIIIYIYIVVFICLDIQCGICRHPLWSPAQNLKTAGCVTEPIASARTRRPSPRGEFRDSGALTMSKVLTCGSCVILMLTVC